MDDDYTHVPIHSCCKSVIFTYMFKDDLHILAHACCKLSKEMHNLLQRCITGSLMRYSSLNRKNRAICLSDIKQVTKNKKVTLSLVLVEGRSSPQRYSHPKYSHLVPSNSSHWCMYRIAWSYLMEKDPISGRNQLPLTQPNSPIFCWMICYLPVFLNMSSSSCSALIETTLWRVRSQKWVQPLLWGRWPAAGVGHRNWP